MIPHRGDVLLARLEPRSGSEQTGTRPVVVVSPDTLNEIPAWRTVTVVPCSTSDRQLARFTAVLLPLGEGGLDRDTVALCHQVTTLDKDKLGARLGRLSSERMQALDAGLALGLGLRLAVP